MVYGGKMRLPKKTRSIELRDGNGNVIASIYGKEVKRLVKKLDFYENMVNQLKKRHYDFIKTCGICVLIKKAESL